MLTDSAGGKKNNRSTIDSTHRNTITGNAGQSKQHLTKVLREHDIASCEPVQAFGSACWQRLGDCFLVMGTVGLGSAWLIAF